MTIKQMKMYDAYNKKSKLSIIPILEYIATILGIISYSLIAILSIPKIGFIFGFVSSVLLVVTMAKKDNFALCFFYVFFLFANFIGYFKNIT